MKQQDLIEEYKVLRDNFKQKKTGLEEGIAIHKKEIVMYRKKISELEEKIESARPRTKNGNKVQICLNCDCYSMRYEGKTPQGGLAGGDEIYECEICGRDNQGYLY